MLEEAIDEEVLTEEEEKEELEVLVGEEPSKFSQEAETEYTDGYDVIQEGLCFE